jgi:hypothetical protein
VGRSGPYHGNCAVLWAFETMGRNGLSRRQWLIVGLMMLTLAVVLAGLGSLVRRSVTDSPLPTAVLPVSRATATATTDAAPTPIAAAHPAQTPTPMEGPADVLAARRIEELGKDVGQIRELPKQQEIPLNFLDAQEMADYLRRIRTDSDRRIAVERQQALFAALGLSPQPDAAFPPTLQTRAKHVIAFYDPSVRQIFIGPAGREAAPPDISLVHQFAHAYIDQHFDLLGFSSGVFNADATRARDALLEGDATAVLALHSFGSVDGTDLDEMSAHLSDVEVTDYEGYLASRAMDDVFVFPYREGTRFVSALLDAGWWPAVNAAYRDPPVSTEQILHPEKYIGNPRDEPRTVLLPDLRDDLDEGWQLVAQNVLGELIVRTHLDQYLPNTEEAMAAAEGWDGDLAALWRNLDDREILVMRTLWDNPEEAAEFSSSYASVVDRRLGGARRVIRSILPSTGRWWRGEEGNAYLQRENDEVLIIWTSDADTMEQVLAVFVFENE